MKGLKCHWHWKGHISLWRWPLSQISRMSKYLPQCLRQECLAAAGEKGVKIKLDLICSAWHSNIRPVCCMPLLPSWLRKEFPFDAPSGCVSVLFSGCLRQEERMCVFLLGPQPWNLANVEWQTHQTVHDRRTMSVFVISGLSGCWAVWVILSFS